MRCDEIMKTDVQVLRPNATIREAAQKMRQLNVGFLPVCDTDGVVLGTITDRDICLRVVADDVPVDDAVDAYMTRDELVVCKPSDDLKHAEQIMGRKHKSRILVCDDQGRLCGVISLSDIAVWEDPGSAAKTMRRVSEREAAH